MELTLRDGTRLAYDDEGDGDRTIVLTHGLGCHRKTMVEQVRHLRDRYRVINVDFRGHGESDKPHQDYHPDVFAHDIAELCAQLQLDQPLLVGHSLGGVVGLRLAHLHPGVPAGLVAMDAAWAVTPAVRSLTENLVGHLEQLDLETYVPEVAAFIDGAFFQPPDDTANRAEIVRSMSTCPSQVFLSCWRETALNTDTVAPIATVEIPVLYIAAENPNGDLDVIRGGPAVQVGQAIGSGHFVQTDCAAQVNSMIDKFLAMHGFA